MGVSVGLCVFLKLLLNRCSSKRILSIFWEFDSSQAVLHYGAFAIVFLPFFFLLLSLSRSRGVEVCVFSIGVFIKFQTGPRSPTAADSCWWSVENSLKSLCNSIQIRPTFNNISEGLFLTWNILNFCLIENTIYTGWNWCLHNTSRSLPSARRCLPKVKQ